MTKLVPENEYLLSKNKVKGVQYSATKSELLTQVKLKPNRKIFFFKAHLWAYQIGKQIKLDRIGEKPVLVDTALVEASALNIHRYLFKKGYYNNEVDFTISQSKWAKLIHQHKLKVVYSVVEGTPYQTGKISIISSNAEIKSIIELSKERSFIKTNTNVDYALLSQERSRINNLLKNNGYYFFNPSYVDFILDSAQGNFTSNIEIHILDPQSGRHQKQKINSVNVEFFTGMIDNEVVYDTTSNIIYKLNGMDIKIDVLTKNILIRKDQDFSQQKLQTTYGRLVDLDLFESLSIQSAVANGDSTLLDVVIQLNPAPKLDFTWQPQLVLTEQRFNQSQSSRNYGLANELSLKNKNVFHNGEEWSINFRTGLETQFTRDSSSIFSTFIQEVNSELKIPHLMFFGKLGNSSKIQSANTFFNVSYLFENNPFYKRNLFPLSFTYKVDVKNIQLYVSPLLISLNKATYKASLIDNASPSYLLTLDRLFTNNLITSMKIGGTFTNIKQSPNQYIVVNSNLLELAGLVTPWLTDFGKKLGVNHSTFVRTDVDFRYHLVLSENHELVLRAFGGVGVPIGSKSVLPFERRFIAGGNNYMRGWRIRNVGPGAFTADNSLQFTRTGEMSTVGNIEYRFNVFEGSVDLNGAVFVDAGNVWNLKKDTLFPDGEIKLDRFYNEIAFNTGLGARFDFDFLILRFDWGVPIWDPNFPIDERLVIKSAFKNAWLLKRPIWNVAVGYPF